LNRLEKRSCHRL